MGLSEKWERVLGSPGAAGVGRGKRWLALSTQQGLIKCPSEHMMGLLGTKFCDISIAKLCHCVTQFPYLPPLIPLLSGFAKGMCQWIGMSQESSPQASPRWRHREAWGYLAELRDWGP